jgi:hypothetical protein
MLGAEIWARAKEDISRKTPEQIRFLRGTVGRTRRKREQEMKRSGTQLKVHCRNTYKKRGYGHISRINENMIQEKNRKFHKKET